MELPWREEKLQISSANLIEGTGRSWRVGGYRYQMFLPCPYYIYVYSHAVTPLPPIEPLSILLHSISDKPCFSVNC